MISSTKVEHRRCSFMDAARWSITSLECKSTELYNAASENFNLGKNVSKNNAYKRRSTDSASTEQLQKKHVALSLMTGETENQSTSKAQNQQKLSKRSYDFLNALVTLVAVI